MVAINVTVIIPAHKTISYFKECVNSVISQSHKEIEIIIACNGDLSIQKCKSFLNINDSRILFIKTEDGRHNARNEALKVANGEYIQYLDYDDLLYQNKISKQIKALKEYSEKDVISICKWKKFSNNINAKYNFPFDHLFENSSISFYELMSSMGRNGGFIATAAWLTPKSLIQNFKWIEVPNDDAVFFSGLFSKNPLVISVNSTLVGYRMHGSNTSNIKNTYQLNLLIKGWSIIYKNIKQRKSKDINHYLLRAYTLLLRHSKELNFYKYHLLLFHYIKFSITSKQSPIKSLKILMKQFL